MLEADSEDWLRLTLIPGLGPCNAIKLLAAFGTPEQILAASAPSLAKIVTERLARAIVQGPDPQALQQALAWLAIPQNRLLSLADADYPKRLLNLPDPPPVLYAKGRLELLNTPTLAIVGSRNATAQGVRDAEAFARSLSEGGWCISSGLALGIDAAAHLGALDGGSATIAVVGTGLDIVYPARNHALAHRIASEGVLISEFPLGTPGRTGNFPRRNRVISGLARGVLVVEAALQSGSLITAREALEQGNEVFAIPGSIHSPLARGCHQLIKQGAKLVETARDILDEIADAPPAKPLAASPAAPPQVDAQSARLLDVLGFEAQPLDLLLERANLTPEQAYAMLLTLELTGQVAKLPGGRYQRLS